METNIINLDKVCAEYGMDTLSLPLYLLKETKSIIKKCKDHKEFLKKRYEDSRLSDNLKDFLKYDLINPLKEYQDKVNSKKQEDRKRKIFEQIKKNLENKKFEHKSYETEITKALGIIVEDGPFAYIIWLKSQDKEPHRAMLIQTVRLLKEIGLTNDIGYDNVKGDIEKEFIEMSGDLSKMIFAKTVIEKMLVYARYKAKALEHGG